MSGRIKMVGIGAVTGAAMWAGGLAIGHAVFKNACMTRPIGSCWRSPLSWMFDFLGDAGITPAFGVVGIICIIYLCVLIGVLPNREGDRLRASLGQGMVVGLLAAMAISALLW